MKNRSSLLFVGGIFILAIIGVTSILIANPTGFLQGIAVILLFGIAIYLIARFVLKADPHRKEQRAFLKAAKQSKKRLHQKNGDSQLRNTSQSTRTTLKKIAKKKSLAQLTVINGKKGKKKNRASF